MTTDYCNAAFCSRRYNSWMPVSDIYIHSTAHLWIQRYGDAATAKAREMVERLRAKGDAEGTDTWLRIIVAIGTLGTPPTDARH